MKIRVWCLLFFSLSLQLFAIEGKIKVFVKQDAPVYTSQKTVIAVELLSTAYSITNAKISFPSTADYVLQAPQSAAYLGQTKIDDRDWQMVHYEYDVYALKAGVLHIPSFDVSFTASMGYGQPEKAFTLKSDALDFDVKSPEGVKEKGFVLVTEAFEIVTQLKPEKKQVIVGEAVTLNVTQKAKNVPDILLRPIRYDSSERVRVYEKEPNLQRGLKGQYDVSRVESFTFTTSVEGNVTLPAHELLWWNPKTKELHKERIESIHFESIADPQIAIDAQKKKRKKYLLMILIGLLAFGLLYRLFAPQVKRWIVEKKETFNVSEKGRFKSLMEALEVGDLSMAYKYFYLWLARVEPELAKEGFNGIFQKYPSFSTSLTLFENALTSKEQSFDTATFALDLKRFREGVLKTKKSDDKQLISTVNP